MPPRLRVVRSTSEQVSLPRYLVVEAAMEATALADELTFALAAIEQRVWAGNRAAAVNEIGRTAYRIEQLRASALELAGLADTAPSDPGAAVNAA